uniref:Uncharacterized protein n=1 Tax=Cacopsylla melanoneura TaxID=428564 RepID=A0A8D8Z8F2_9HEMI
MNTQLFSPRPTKYILSFHPLSAYPLVSTLFKASTHTLFHVIMYYGVAISFTMSPHHSPLSLLIDRYRDLIPIFFERKIYYDFLMQCYQRNQYSNQNHVYNLHGEVENVQIFIPGPMIIGNLHSRPYDNR